MKTFLLACISVAIVVCATQERAFSQTTSSMYPMRLGSSWTFQSFNSQYTETIIGQTQINGETWYLFDTFRNVDSVWVQLANDLSLYLKKDGMDSKWVDFYSPLHGTWKASVPGRTDEFTATLLSRTDSLFVPYGMFTNVYHFYFSWDGADNDLSEYYVNDIGPVKRVLYGFGVIEDELVDYNQTTSTDEIPAAQKASFSIADLYPNPATSDITFSVRINDSYVSGEYTVSDLLGRTVYGPKSFTLSQGTYQLVLPAVRFHPGQYMLSVASSGGVQSRMIIVR